MMIWKTTTRVGKEGCRYMAACGGVGMGGLWTTTGAILVLYILLVIILKSGWF